MTDPIADFLTRIRNAVKANHKVVEAPGSKIKQEITKILYEQGYILAYKFDTDEKVSVADMPRVLNGLGIAVLSSSKGIMTDAKARKENVGGEVLCYIY